MTTIPAEFLREWDVVVVGAGVAGATAANRLARSGAKVLLIDRSDFPRYKVCGCCLNLRATRLLHQLDIEPRLLRARAIPLKEFRMFARGWSAGVPLTGGFALSRERLDRELCEAANQVGVKFLPGVQAQLESANQDGVNIELIGPSGTGRVRARAVVCADGLQGSFLRNVEMAPARVSRNSRVGMGAVAPAECHSCQPGVIYMACGEGGYVGMTVLEDGRLNLAAALDVAGVRSKGPTQIVETILAQADLPVPRRLADAVWKGTPPLTRRRDVAQQRIFLVGDAAGYVEPFTGEGMAWALEGGKAVALHVQALLEGQEGQEARWRSSWRRIIGRRQWTCRGLSWLLRHPALVGATVRLLRMQPAFAQPVLQLLNHRAKEVAP